MKRTRLKPVSKKRAGRLKIYYGLIKEYKKIDDGGGRRTNKRNI